MTTPLADPPELAALEADIRASGSPLSVGEVLRLLLDALSEIRQGGRRSDAGTRWFNSEELDALASVGLASDPSEGPTSDPAAEGAAQSAALWATALRVADAAGRLDVAPSRVRQRLGERSLYGVKRSGEWRLPAFQFEGQGLVEGIDLVLRNIPQDMHPVAVWNWFRFPKPELETERDRVLSPLEWLRSGLPVAPVTDLMRDASTTL